MRTFQLSILSSAICVAGCTNGDLAARVAEMEAQNGSLIAALAAQQEAARRAPAAPRIAMLPPEATAGGAMPPGMRPLAEAAQDPNLPEHLRDAVQALRRVVQRRLLPCRRSRRQLRRAQRRSATQRG
jgi:hypothetical protein